jgi:hypothetical protein
MELPTHVRDGPKPLAGGSVGRARLRTREWRYTNIYELIEIELTSFARDPDVKLRSEIGKRRRRYPTGKKVTARDLRELNIERAGFHGEWNYVIHPRTEMR